jgi:hypothetical protein
VKDERISCRVVDVPLERDFHPAWACDRNQPNLRGAERGQDDRCSAHAKLEVAITIERFVEQ